MSSARPRLGHGVSDEGSPNLVVADDGVAAGGSRARLGEPRQTAVRSSRGRVLARFRRHWPAMIGLMTLLLLIVVAVFAPWIAPADPYAIDLTAYRNPPAAEHLLGTDTTGRDVLSRLIYGARVSLSVGLVAVSISVAIGTLVGAVSGYYRGGVDAVLMRVTDTVLCFPPLIIILVVVSVLGPSIFNAMLAIGLLQWTGIARLVRGQVLSVRERDFVDAARCSGATNARVVYRHILPEVVGPITVAATFGMATAVLTEAGLSFLGLGVQPPTASWGNMLTDAQSLTILEGMAWLWLPPGALILATVLAINFVGDGLHDAFDPRQISG